MTEIVPSNIKDICIDDNLDALIQFRVTKCIKKMWIDLCNEIGARNPSEILRWWFISMLLKEKGLK